MADRPRGAQGGAEAGGAGDRQGAPGGVDPVRQPDQSGAPARVRATDAVVTDLDGHRPALEGDPDRRVVGPGVLDHVRQRLGDDEVRRGLGRRRHPWIGDVQIDRDGEVRDERLEPGAQAPAGERRGQDAVDDVAELVVGPLGIGQGLVEQLGGRRSVGERVPGELERDDRVDEPLLGAVVHVALEAAAGLVGGGDHAGPGCGELRPGVGVRDPDGRELGELGETGLDAVAGEGVGVVRHERGPHPTLDGDRDGRRRPDTDLAGDDRQRRALVGVHARGSTGPPEPVHRRAGARRHVEPDRSGTVAGRDDDRARVVVEHQGHREAAEQGRRLVGDGDEDLLRRRPPGDELGDPAQGPLLLDQRPQVAARLAGAECGGDQLRELVEPPAGARWQRPRRGGRGEHAPDLAAHRDRRGDRRSQPEGGGELGVGLVRVVVDPDEHRLPAHEVGQRVGAEGDASPDGRRPAVGGDDDELVVPDEAVERRRLPVEQAGGLGRDDAEDLARRRGACHQLGDLAEGGLLAGHPSRVIAGHRGGSDRVSTWPHPCTTRVIRLRNAASVSTTRTGSGARSRPQRGIPVGPGPVPPTAPRPADGP